MLPEEQTPVLGKAANPVGSVAAAIVPKYRSGPIELGPRPPHPRFGVMICRHRGLEDAAAAPQKIRLHIIGTNSYVVGYVGTHSTNV